ncbi:MAG: hypothetical protein KJZ54_01800 [Phycisphaerales bacterium]|nr:hypothetical protein [Phycisphaerales bacterium]
MEIRCDAEAPIPFDLHLAHENRAARECATQSARRVTPCPPIARGACVRGARADDAPRAAPTPRPDSARLVPMGPDAPRLAEVAAVPVRPKVERIETTYRLRRFMPRGSMIDFTV